MRPHLRKIARAGAVAVLAPFITCSDFTGPSGRGVHVPVVPTFSESAVFAKELYASAGLEFDRVRVIIARGETVLKDTSVAFSPSSAELELPLLINATAGEIVTATLEYRTADVVLYSGTASVKTVAVGSPETAATPIVLAPVGPGASADRVEVTPASGSFPTTAPITLTAQAFTTTNTPIANALFGWSVDDETIATVSALGVVQPTTKGGVVKVRATTLNQKFGEATISFVRIPASLVIQSGGSQTGLAQDPLAAPVVVKVADVNGLGVPGAAVAFAVTTGGGAITVINGTSDAAGLVSVNWTLGETAGAQSITATASALPNAPLTITATANPRPAVALSFLQKPSNAPMKVTIVPSVTIKALNDKGGVVTGYTGAITVALEANPGTATLGGTLTQNAVGGVATFANLTVSAAGVGYTLKATATGLTPVTSPAFTIEQVASTLTLAGGGGQTAVVGSLLSPISVKVADANGLGVPGVTVSFDVVSGGGNIVVENAVTDASGIAKVKWTLGSTAGTQSIKATVAGLTGSPVTIEAQATALPPVGLAFVQQPSNVAMGATMSPAVTVRAVNSNGETVTGFTGAVTIALDANPGSATLGGTLTANAVSGVATFSDLTVSHAGTGYTLKASATGFANVISSTFDASPVVAGLAFAQQPSNVKMHTTMTPAVTVKAVDANGLVVATFAGAVTITLDANPGSATLAGTATVNAVNGIATFATLQVSHPGTGYTFQASATGLSNVTSTTFDVAQEVISISFIQGPSNVVTNATMTPAVTVRAVDFNNNTVTGFTGTIVLSLGNNTYGATLGGTLSVAAVGGVATFSNLSVDVAASDYTLNAAFGTLSASSGLFVVSNPTPVALLFQVPPSTAVVGVPISPAIKVRIVDANGVTVPGRTDSVTLSKEPALLDAGFGGRVKVAAVNGVATFDSVFVFGYTGSIQLKATSGTLTPVVSAAFTITPPPAAHRTWLGLSTDWSDANNWSPAGVPAAIDSATIAAGATNYPIITGFATAKAIIVEAGASLGINSLSGVFAEKLLNRGTLTLTSASISGDVENPGTAIINGFASANKWTTTSTGLTRVTSPGLDGAGLIVNTVYVNEGQLELTETVASDAEMIVNDSLVNRNGATITVAQGLGGQRTISAVLHNYGAVNVATSAGLYLLQNATGSVNAGTMTFSAGGNLYMYGADSTHTFSNIGTMAMGTGLWEVLELNFKSTVGTVTGTGQLRTFYSQVDLDFTKFSPSLRIDLDTRFPGTTITIPALTTVKVLDGDFTQPIVVAGTLDLSDVTLAGPRVFVGGISIGATGVVTASSDVEVDGPFAIASGGKLRLVPTGANRYFEVGSSFTNQGAIELTSSGGVYEAALRVSGTLTNAATGTISAEAGSGGGRLLAATLNNLGAITVEGTAYLTLRRGAATHTNSGTITLAGTATAGSADYNNKSFTIQGSESSSTFNNTGTINIGSNRSVYVDFLPTNTLNNQSGGVIAGTGRLRVATSFGSTFTNTGSLRPGGLGAAGTLTFEGNLTLGTGTLEIEVGGDLTGQYDRLEVTGSVTAGGTLQVTQINGYAPNNSFQILTGSSCLGDFATFAAGPAWGGFYNDGCFWIWSSSQVNELRQQALLR